MTLARQFWKAEPGWVFWRSDDGTLLPLNVQTRLAMVIEDDEEASRIRARMERDGIPVVDDLKTE